MSSEHRYSFIREVRRIRDRRLRIARYLSGRDSTTGRGGSEPGASQESDAGREPDVVVRHRLRESGYDPDRWRNDPHLLMARMMRLFTILAITGGAVVVFAAHSGTAYAAAKTGTLGLLAEPNVDALNGVINKVTTWLVVLLASVATLFLTIGGVRYVLASGDPGEVEKAKSALKSAAVGYALALLAPAIISVVGGLFKQ